MDIAGDIADRQKGTQGKKEWGSKDIQVRSHWGCTRHSVMQCRAQASVLSTGSFVQLYVTL